MPHCQKKEHHEVTPVVGVIYIQNLVEFPENRVECQPRTGHESPEGE